MEEYDRQDHQHRVEQFFKLDPLSVLPEERPYPAVAGDLSAACYAVSELRLWPDSVDSVSPEQAIACWKIVEKLRTHEFPPELKM